MISGRWVGSGTDRGGIFNPKQEGVSLFRCRLGLASCHCECILQPAGRCSLAVPRVRGKIHRTVGSDGVGAGMLGKDADSGKRIPEIEPSKRRKRRGYEPVPAIDPTDGRLMEALISHARMDAVAKRGMGHAKDLAYSEREVLMAPTAIFRGVRDEGERDWLCYVGIPKHSYAADGTTRPPRQGRVYLVFVTDGGIAYHGRWDSCDPEDANLPIDYQNRFQERVM